MTRQFVKRAAWSLVVALFAASAHARPPEIRNIDLRGLQAGAATALTVDGVELLPAPRVFLNEKPVEAVVDPKSTATRALVSVTVPADAAPGIAILRWATADGFSNGVAIGVDRLPQAVIAEETKALPAALHGSVPGSGVSRTTFEGKAGQELIVEVEAKRLGSKLRPVLHLYDARRTQLAWAMPSNTLGGDCRLVTKLPADGRYTVELHDAQYGPPGPSFFRLKIGQWEFADLAFPPVVPRGQETALQLIGRVSAGMATFRPSGDDLVAPAPMVGAAVSGPPPAVSISTLPELVAQPPAAEPQPLPGVPSAISGRLAAPGQKGRFLVPVKPGQKLTFEVFADRIGSRIDTVLELRNKTGAVLAANDDLPATPGLPGTTDSRLEYTVPDGIDAVEANVRDTLEVGGDAAIYRLVVTSSESPAVDFDVVLKTDVINVPAGETQAFEVFVRREGYAGPIRIEAADLPEGVTLGGTEIVANATGTLLTLTNGGAAPTQRIGRLKAVSGDGAMKRPVRVDGAADDRTPVWLRERIAFAAAPKHDAPFTVAWSEPSAPTQLVLTNKLTGQVKIARPPSTYGPVRLTLLVSQNPPRVNGQLNPAFNMRLERALELPVDPKVRQAGDAFLALEKQHLDALTKAAAAQGDAKVAADKAVADLIPKKEAAAAALKDAESKAAYATDVPVIVPVTLTDPSCDVTLKAELLNPERNQTLRTAYAPVRRLPVVNPLALKLVTTPLEATLDPKTGATLKIEGRIERLADYKGAATVQVAGVPPGVSLPAVNVPADKSDFTVDLRLPPNYMPNELKGVKLTAVGPADPLSGNLQLKSPEVELVVSVKKAEAK